MELRLKWLAAFCLNLFLSLALHAQSAMPEKPVKFDQKKITLSTKKTITVEMAETDQQHEYGLMLRKSLPKDHGMLFIFKDEDIRNFWMKNTIINLSIGYYDKNKKLIDIQEMKAVTSIMQENLPTYPSAAPAMYALEMPETWFSKNKIKLGSSFQFAK